ncbi:MAG: hypothetical protein ABWY25_10175 [Paenisporosarcina sp.]
MELTETIESLNRQLIDLYGIDTVTGDAMWRIVWSDDQWEHRHGLYEDYSPGGIYLRTVEETRWVPKYRQWIQQKYVLERLVLVPEMNIGDLPATKLSYEPIYTFETPGGSYLPPRLDAAKFIIDTLMAAQGKGNLAKYKDPFNGLNADDYAEMKKKEINDLQTELFGNETAVGDSLAHGEAIIVPRNFKEEN